MGGGNERPSQSSVPVDYYVVPDGPRAFSPPLLSQWLRCVFSRSYSSSPPSSSSSSSSFFSRIVRFFEKRYRFEEQVSSFS